MQAAPGQVLDPALFNTQLNEDGVVVYQDFDEDGDLDEDDHLTSKRTFDDTFDQGSSQEEPTPATQPMPDGGAGQVPTPAAGPDTTLGQELAVTAESLMLLMNPLAASIVAQNTQTGHFHRMDERASKIFAAWNALTGNQHADGSTVIPFTQTILDGLAVAQHAVDGNLLTQSYEDKLDYHSPAC